VEELREIINQVEEHAREGGFLDQQYYEEMKNQITFTVRKMI
jgi:predicted small metal-binding protein